MKMKRLIIFYFLFLVITQRGMAQIPDFIPLPKDTAIWIYEEDHYWRPDLDITYNLYFLIGDTTIDQQIYRKLYGSVHLIYKEENPISFEEYRNSLTFSKIIYIGALREEMVKRKIYMLPKDSSSQGEYILYDYDIEKKGDTIYWDTRDVCFGVTLLAELDSIKVDEKWVKMYITNEYGEFMQLYGGRCDYLTPCQSLFERGCGMCFYSQSYPEYSFGECGKLLDIMKYNTRITKIENVIKISQNVNGTQITIDQLNCDEHTISLYTIDGKEIWQKSFTSCPKEVLNVPELPIGIYFIRLASESGFVNQKLIRQ